MPFSVKMAESTLTSYKKEKRRENRSRVRQALFISEYVFYKYFTEYQEAAQMYNDINRLYPRKPDLRRTPEFRVWKNGITVQSNTANNKTAPAKYHTYVFPPHADIPVAECIDPSHSVTVMVQPERPQQQERPSAESPKSPPPVSLSSHKPEKIMELKIPLISPPAETRQALPDTPIEPAIYTQTLQTVTEEVLQEGVLEPSLHEEISPEIVQKIIEELRQDTGLKDIMTKVEEQIEIEEVGLEVDIADEYDRLEADLEDLIFW